MDKLIKASPVKEYRVLSASRMTDMPKFYPNELINEVKKRRNNGTSIHTLVLWTKHPKSLITKPLLPFLMSLKNDSIQLYIQLTITGLGKIVAGKKPDGSNLILEPNAPEYSESLRILPEVINLVGGPKRIRLRIDPIVRIRDFQGNVFTSNDYFLKIVDHVRKLGVKTISYSFLEKNVHRKVDNRLKKAGCEIIAPNGEERQEYALWMKEIENKYVVNIYSCSIPDMPVSKCIDGELLEQLHDKKHPVSKKQLKKRKLCGCTESIDLGGWPPKRCYTGCLYCYANACTK